MVRIEGQYSVEDFQAAQKLHFRSPRGKFVFTCSGNFLLFAVVFLLAGFIGAAFLKLPGGFFLLIPAGLAAGYIFFELIQRPRQVKRMFEQQKELSMPFEIEISEAGFGFQNANGTGLRPWDQFARWKEDGTLFMLYRSDIVFDMIPKRLLAGEEAGIIRQLLAQNIVPVPVVVNKRATWVLRIAMVFLFVVIAVAFLYMTAHSGGR